MQYTRNVHFELKPNKTDEFRTLFDRDVVPMLKAADGFKGELALIRDNHAVGISLWKDRASAESYQTNTYPNVLKTLEPLMVGKPKIETWDVAMTTLSV